jgi:hypothetical protein
MAQNKNNGYAFEFSSLFEPFRKKIKLTCRIGKPQYLVALSMRSSIITELAFGDVNSLSYSKNKILNYGHLEVSY